MGRLRDRQAQLYRNARRARTLAADNYGFMVTAPHALSYEDAIGARSGARPSVLAFLFAFPDSSAMRSLDHRGEYFNVRTGTTWDLFFPGYFESKEGTAESSWGSQPAGSHFAAHWYFNPQDFDKMRRHVEDHSGGLWKYSGGTDLVLVNVWTPLRGGFTIDWESTQSGCIETAQGGSAANGLPHLIERISHDLEHGDEDPAYGVPEILRRPGSQKAESAARSIMIGALGDMLGTLGKRAFGLE